MKYSKKIYYCILIVLVTLFNLTLVFNNNVWCDEAFVMNACKLNFADLTQYIYDVDMRPPVYLLAAKFFSMIFGLSVPTLKIFSLIPAVLCMILGATIVDKNWGHGKIYVGTIFILLNALAPITITKNIEISMYSWVLFFITCSAIFAYNIVCYNGKKRDWIIFIISALGAASMHYYAVLTEIFIYLFLYIALLIKDKKNIKQCIISAIATIICYIPVLPFFFHQFGVASDTFWITKTNMGTILSALRMVFEGENTFKFSSEFTMFFWILILGIFVRMIITCYNSYMNKQKMDKTTVFAVLCILIIIFFLFSCLVLSKLIRPLFVNRYMYVNIGLLWLYISIVFGSHISEKTEKTFCIGAIICLILFAYPTVKDREYNTKTEPTVAYMYDLLEDGDILINNNEECMNWCLNYYFPEYEAYLNCDEDKFYKNELFDFSTLDTNTTAWYLAKDELDIPQEIIEKENLVYEQMESGSIDNYYFFTIYKITKE